MPHRDDIAVSGTGVRLPYLRFLADVSGGILLVLLLVLVLPWQQHLTDSGPKDVRILIGILSLLMIPALGLTLNAVGWFLLGWFGWFRGRTWFRVIRRFPCACRGFTEKYRLPEAPKLMGVDERNFTDKTELWARIAAVHRPDLLEGTQHAKGLRRFLRSVAVLSLASFVAAVVAELRCDGFGWAMWTWSTLGWVVSLPLISLLECHEGMELLTRIYVVVVGQEGLEASRKLSEEEILRIVVSPRAEAGATPGMRPA